MTIPHPEPLTWATRVTDRIPEVKYYSKLSHAMAALVYRATNAHYAYQHKQHAYPEMEMYQLNQETDEWDLVYEVPSGIDPEQLKEHLESIQSENEHEAAQNVYYV